MATYVSSHGTCGGRDARRYRAELTIETTQSASHVHVSWTASVTMYNAAQYGVQISCEGKTASGYLSSANSSGYSKVASVNGAFSVDRGTSSSVRKITATAKGVTVSGYGAADGSVSVTQEITIPAVDSYMITYKPNAENVTSLPEQQTKKHDEDIVLSSVEPQREGYFLYEWNTSTDTNGIPYLPGETYSENANLTLYAIWEEKGYKVNYHGNGGFNCPTVQTKWHFSDLTLSAQTPTRSGYKFLGWSTTSDLNANKVTYNPGDTYTLNANIDLYALWEAQNVAYYKIGGKYVLCNTYGKVNGKWQPRLMYIKVNGVYVRSNASADTGHRTIDSITAYYNDTVQYYVGEPLTEIIISYIEVKYSDGTYQGVDRSDCIITNETSLSDSLIEGDNVIRVSYGGVYYEFIIEGIQPEGTLLYITASTTQNIFVGTPINDLISGQKILVTARYSDGSTVDITNACAISYAYEIIIEGNNEITVTYKDATTTLDIYGHAEVTISYISASYNGGQVVAGTSLDALFGTIDITATYSDNSTIDNITEGYTLSSDSGKIIEGRNSITVTYEGKTSKIYVTGIPNEISGIEYGNTSSLVVASWNESVTAPTSISYANSVEIVGGKIQLVNPSTVSFSKSGSGNNYNALLGKYIISGTDVYYITTNSEYEYETNVSQYVVARITYYSTLKLNSTVESIEIDRIEAMYIGDSVEVGTSASELDSSDIIVTVFYTDETSHTVTNYSLSGSITNVGNNTITVTYEGEQDTFNVEGKQTQTPEATLESISVKYTGETELSVGTSISSLYDYVEVTAIYSDGSRIENVTGYTLSSGTIVEGSNTITATYEGKTNQFVVIGVSSETPEEPEIPEATVRSISATYEGDKVKVGTSINSLSGINITATYSDDSVVNNIREGYTLTYAYDTIRKGSNLINVTYGGATSYINVPGYLKITNLRINYEGGDVEIGTSLGDLFGLTVVGIADDGTEDTEITYTLSGTIALGRNIITVHHINELNQEITDTFEVEGVEGAPTIIGIVAEYIGEGVTIGTSLSNIPTSDIVVKLEYSDGTITEVTGYNMSGSIKTVGNNEIEVSYDGCYTKMNVIGTEVYVYKGDIVSLTVGLWASGVDRIGISYGDNIGLDNGNTVLVSPKTATFYRKTSSNYSQNSYTVLRGKYIKSGIKFYYIEPSSTYEHTTLSTTESLKYNSVREVSVSV